MIAPALNSPIHLDITLEDNAMVADIKKAIKMLRGISSVRIARPKATKCKTKYTEQEFYAKLDKSIESAKHGPLYTMASDESAEEFINRILAM